MEDFIPDSAMDSKDTPRASISILPSFRANYVTDADRQRATELMHQQRVLDKKEKKSKKSEPFTWKEANPVLAAIIADKKNPASPGLVQALLGEGANVSIAVQKSKSFFKKVIRADQKEQRSDLLAQATQNCGPEVVWLLTENADDTARSEALPFAIRQNSPTKAQILIAAGTDASTLCTEFMTAVENQWVQMIQVLLSSATKGACQTCRDRGLVKATQKGSMIISQMLLDKGANSDFESGAALQKALEDGREDIVNAITACAKRPSPKSLDIAVDTAYVKLEKDAEKQYRMVETCLKTGAKGSKTDETLVQACKKGQNQLIDALIAHGASVDHNSGAALQFAITSKQPDLLTTLLQGKPSNSTMAAVIKYTMVLDDLNETHGLIDILLSAGLRGDSVAETLIKAIETGIPGGTDSGHLELIRLLLEKGDANVNFQDGRSIVLAVTQGRSDVLDLLLQHTPSVDSLNVAFPHAVDIRENDQRLKIATMILEAGAKGKVIDEALAASAKTGKDGASLTSAILKQSSVDYDGGKPLTNAVNSRCLEQIKVLIAGNPSASTVTAAWTEADAIEDDEFRLKAFEVLLTSSVGVDASLQDQSLVVAAARGQRGLPICSLLLQNQASPERLEAAALVAAAKGLHLDTLSLLAKYVTLPAAFLTTFDAFSDGEQWLQPRGLEIVHFMLEHGVAGPEVDASFCKAARLYEADALELLATSIDPEIVNVALILVTQSTDDWLSIDNRNLWLVHSLLEWGAQGESVNIAFLKALDSYCQGLASEELIDTFLSVGNKANVNIQGGAPLQIAIRYGKPLLLKKLATHGATQETISQAFAEAIIAPLEEDVLLSLIDVLTKNKTFKPDYRAPLDGYQPPLFACLAAHPKSAKLVERLIKLGCDVEAQAECFLYDDEEIPSEKATVLAWALSQGMLIESAAINALIDGKANINFVAEFSKTTILILAAKNSRGDIVSKLVKMKANTSARDQFDRSALFYASRIGDLDAVSALVKKAPVNDGSLQEAARNLHSEVVAALIKGHHSPNFPSSKEQHQGRTALQEMALMCDASNNLTGAETTIKALMKGKLKVLEKVRDKNALFLALDNAHPIPITKALLDSLMWEHINHVDNVYVEVDSETGTKYYFSPTTYVSRGFSQGPESDNGMLLNLLRDKRCEDRYYAEEGAEQPDDATGIPKHIAEAEKKRKEHEEKLRKKEMEHQVKLLHSKQEAELKAEIERSKHDEKIFREDEMAQQKLELKEQMHQQQLIQEAEKAAQKQGIANSANDLKIAMQEKAEESKLRAQKARAEFEEIQKARMSQLKALAMKQEQDLKLEFTSKANAQKLALKEQENRLAVAATERKLITAQRMAQTKAAEAEHKLAIKQKQDQLALTMMKGTAKQKQELHNMKMREVQAQSETMKLKMLDKYFASQPKNLKRITAG